MTIAINPVISGSQLRILSGVAAPVGAATTVFIIPHGMGSLPVFATVESSNTLSTALFAVTWDATNITVTFLVGLTGTLSLSWVAFG